MAFLSSGTVERHREDIGRRCSVSGCPRSGDWRIIDILSKRVVVMEVDVIELPIDHECEGSSSFLFVW